MPIASIVGSASGKSDSQAAPRLPRHALTYGSLILGVIFVSAQIAPPHMPEASAAGLHQDASGLLPALPAASGVQTEPAPSKAVFEITLPYPANGDLTGLLVRSGAVQEEAKRAAGLVQNRFDGHVDEGSDVKLALGPAREGQGHSIEQLTILSDLGRTVIARQGDTLQLADGDAKIDRLDIAIGSAGVHHSLLGAGLDARLALEAASLLDKRAKVPRRITVVVGERPDRFEGNGTPQLLYISAANGHSAVRLLRWPGVHGGWIDADKEASEKDFAKPVEGRISSRFGTRFHPILRFLRRHEGVDYAARWGEPVRAAADGRVAAAAWQGGYGRQVRINHGNDVTTSYSHLSDIAVAPGTRVRRGQVIGYVGASGLATGPHLHFEVARQGKRVDPLRAGLAGSTTVADRAAVAARLAQLRIDSGG